MRREWCAYITSTGYAYLTKFAVHWLVECLSCDSTTSLSRITIQVLAAWRRTRSRFNDEDSENFHPGCDHPPSWVSYTRPQVDWLNLPWQGGSWRGRGLRGLEHLLCLVWNLRMWSMKLTINIWCVDIYILLHAHCIQYRMSWIVTKKCT